MDEYLSRYEYQPNIEQIHVDAVPKREIWKEYIKSPLPLGFVYQTFCFSILFNKKKLLHTFYNFYWFFKLSKDLNAIIA